MSEQIHTTSTRDAQPSPFFSGKAKDIAATLLTAALIAYGTSWWNAQKSQFDTINQLQRLEEKAEINAKNIAQNASGFQQNAIRLAEIGIIQSNLLEQLKDVKQEQNEIKLMLNRK